MYVASLAFVPVHVSYYPGCGLNASIEVTGFITHKVEIILSVLKWTQANRYNIWDRLGFVTVKSRCILFQ